MKNANTLCLAPLLALAIVTAGALPASATTITVNTTAQSSANPADCTLTQAILSANTDTAVNGCTAGSGPDTIELPANQTLILAVAYDADLNGLPPITSHVTIEGNGATLERQSADAFRILQVGTESDAGTLILDNVAIRNGWSTSGGGIQCTGVEESEELVTPSTLSLNNTTVANNRAAGSGQGRGGGIAATLCNVTLTNSTVSANTAWIDNTNTVSGGGLYLNSSTTVLTNTTVSGNVLDSNLTVNASGFGAGISVGLGTLTLNHSTVSANVSLFDTTHGSGGGLANVGGDVTLRHSIISGNSSEAATEIYNAVDVEVVGTVHGDSYNLIGVNGDAGSVNFTPSGTDIVPAAGVTISAILNSLANNGGPTETHSLPLGSPALDKVPSTDCPATDQRGVARGGAFCDIGSFERGFLFTGFLRPVDNPETVNFVKAGAAVPVKFQLGGNQGLTILAEGSPTSRPIVCESAAVLDPIATTETAGGSTLSYDAATQTYTYVWKTEKAWSKCREFSLTLSDGTVHTALFKFWK